MAAPTGSDPLVVYADASALVKLLVEEAETEALEGFLQAREVSVVSSAIARVEIVRAIRLAGAGPDAERRTQDLLDEIRVVAVTEAVLSRAAHVGPMALRTLDRIHLGSALEVQVGEMLVYDHRLAEAAHANGILVTSPGA